MNSLTDDFQLNHRAIKFEMRDGGAVDIHEVLMNYG